MPQDHRQPSRSRSAFDLVQFRVTYSAGIDAYEHFVIDTFRIGTVSQPQRRCTGSDRTQSVEEHCFHSERHYSNGRASYEVRFMTGHAGRSARWQPTGDATVTDGADQLRFGHLANASRLTS
jgi:hypothetical protein